MKIQPEVARQLLQKFDFKTLFREQLGWDNYATELPLQLDGTEYRLSGVAHKRGFAVYLCDALPDSATRLKLYRRAAKATHEQLLIYAERAAGVQVWHWERREGSTIAPREERYETSKSGEALIQKLEILAVDIEEEEALTLPDVKARTKIAFDKERVTKRFYDTFKTEHRAFMGFIRGIKAAADLGWYTSLMMNRMMFIYFIQKKGFLDDDVDYLRHRLRLVRKRKGRDKFQTFYRYFLLRLFHEGLGSNQRNPELDELLGKVPYLNGGFFEVHELERKYDIDIPDKAFEQLFEFFDAWEWTLDDRPLRKDNEINPDVVGYIFEKYVNQKQMGAYYTKEDITEYISKNTVLPHLFDAAKKECAVAFRPDGLLWRMLETDPDRYIYEPVRRGVIRTDGQVIPLPPGIEVGINDVSQRGGWNRPADPQFALPTETWREHVARRKRCLEIRAELAAGEVHEINDLVTLNLDIWQFARDAITNAEGPELLRAFWHALQKTTVLDPACGSGAFLFAALRVLETLYSACIERMRQFLDDLDRSGEKHRPEKFRDFRQVLADIEAHPNQSYYVLKSIIISNLYGVDIMEEAVEICKLRLFLKLAAQVRTVGEIEPLPDIDFNIRAGNSLVGFTSLDAVQEAMKHLPVGQSRRLLYGREQAALKKIEEQAETADRQFQLFRHMQTEKGMRPADFASAKAELRKRLNALRLELDRYLAGEYAIDPDNSAAFQKWRPSHQPFHWFVEYYGIMRAGGFDAIIGNPPYIARRNVEREYTVLNFTTKGCSDIYAWFLERSTILTAAHGRSGMIVPLSLSFSGDFNSCRRLLFSHFATNWFSSYARIPSALFSFDVRVRNVIHLASSTDGELYFTTRLHRWFDEARSVLFHTIEYARFDPHAFAYRVPKLNTTRLASCLADHLRDGHTLRSAISSSPTKWELYFKKTAYNWLTFCKTLPPCYDSNGKNIPHTKFGLVYFRDDVTRNLAYSFLNGKISFCWWAAIGDDFDVTRWMFEEFPLCLDTLTPSERAVALSIATDLDAEMKKNISFKLNANRKVGNYNLARCRHVTDRSDEIFAQHLHLDGAYEDIELLYSQTVRTEFEEEE